MVRAVQLILLTVCPCVIQGQQLEESLPQDQNPEHFDPEFWEQNSKLNINTCTTKELMNIPWIKPGQAHNLVLFRQTYGPFKNFYQLQAVPGWDIQTIKNTLPLLKQFAVSKNPLPIPSQNYILLRWKPQLQKKAGFNTTSEHGKFQGPPHHWLVRFRYRSNQRMDIGVLFDQDAGESWKWSASKGQFGFDHSSAFLQYRPKSKLFNRILLGDFQVHWDQGLLLGHGFNFGAPIITGVKKVHRGFYPHTSSQEHTYYRGAAAQLQYHNWILEIILSQRRPDARRLEIIDQDDKGVSRLVTSQVTTGLHRNLTELAQRRSQRSRVAGFHLNKRVKKGLDFSISYVFNRLKYPLVPNPRPYNRHYFMGQTNGNWGISFNYYNSLVHTFGQIALSRSQGVAFQAGFLTSLSAQWSISGQIRWFDPTYHAVGSGSKVRNERGIYWGLAWQPKNQITVSASFDYSSNPQLAFNIYQPSFAWKSRLQVEYLPHKDRSLILNYQRRLFYRNQPGQLTPLYTVESQHKDLLQLKGQWKNNTLQLRARVQASRLIVPGTNSIGYLISSEIHRVGAVAITLGQAIFNANDFSNRQYHYERDLRFAFSLPGFQNKGNRWYIMASCKISPKWQIWWRFAETIYENREEIGQSWDKIIGNRTSEFKAQILYKL